MANIEEQNNELKDELIRLKWRYDEVKEKKSLRDVKEDIDGIIANVKSRSKELSQYETYKFQSEIAQVFDVVLKLGLSYQERFDAASSRISTRFISNFDRLTDMYEAAEDASLDGTLTEDELQELRTAIKRLDDRIDEYKKELDLDTDTLSWVSIYVSNITRMVQSVLEMYKELPSLLEDRQKPIYACEAEYIETGKAKTDPDGILYISDEYIAFRQKETVGKTFGMFGGEDKDEVIWSFPVTDIAAIENVVESGLFSEDKEFLQFSHKKKIYKIRIKEGWSPKTLSTLVQKINKQDWERVFELIRDDYGFTIKRIPELDSIGENSTNNMRVETVEDSGDESVMEETPSTALSLNNLEQELEKIFNMKEKGMIDDEEYNTLKKKLLERHM